MNFGPSFSETDTETETEPEPEPETETADKTGKNRNIHRSHSDCYGGKPRETKEFLQGGNIIAALIRGQYR